MYLESGKMLNKFTFNEHSLDDWIMLLVWTFIPKINSSQNFKPWAKQLYITGFVLWLLMLKAKQYYLLMFSVLGSYFFSFYIISIGDLIHYHGLNCYPYSDDSNLNFRSALSSIFANDISLWMYHRCPTLKMPKLDSSPSHNFLSVLCFYLLVQVRNLGCHSHPST